MIAASMEKKIMQNAIRVAVFALSLAALGACTQLSSEDKALLATANSNAEQAKVLSQQALDAAKSAQADVKAAVQAANLAAQGATQAAQAADRAAQAARDESEKVDRMFGHSLRKTGKGQ